MAREAKLTLRLVDAVSGPGKAAAATLRNLQGTIRGLSGAVMAPSRAIADMSRNVRNSTYNMAPAGAALGLGITKVAKDVYNMEKSLNVSVAAGGLEMEQRNEFMAEAVRLNAEYAATATEIVDAGNKLLRAGLDYDQMMGSLPGVLSTAQAMDVPMEAASAAVVNSMVSMRMAMDDTESTMKSSIRTADLYAHAVNETTGELDDFAVSSRYFNPVAASMGLSPEQTMAYQVALAKNGIMGSSAGTGLRASPVRIAAPSPKAMEAMGRLGINPANFLGDRTGNVTGAGIAGMLESFGYSGEDLSGEIDGIIADPAFANAPVKLANAILDRFEDAMVVTGEDRSTLANALQRAILAGSSEIDLIGFLKEMRAKDATTADYAQIFGLHHASKMQAIDPSAFDEILAKIEAEAAGTSMRMREAMMAGIVGDVAEMTAAIEKMSISIGKAGLLEDASKAIDRFARSISNLADSNPALIRMASYAAIALAGIAPLGFALMGAGAALSLFVNPLAWVVAGLGTLVALNIGPIGDAIAVFGKSAFRAFDPVLVSRVRNAASAMKSFFVRTLTENQADALGQAARNAGIGFAQAINAMHSNLPKLREFGSAMAEWGRARWAEVLPQITSGVSSLREAFDGIVMSKLDGFLSLGASFADFMERAGPAMNPAVAPAISLIGESFVTLAKGFAAVGRVMGGVTEGLAAFFGGVFANIDTAALAQISAGVAAFLTEFATGLAPLQGLFEAINLDMSGFAGGAGAAVGKGITDVISILSGSVQPLIGAWEAVKGVFAQIGSYMPNFGPIVEGVRSFVNTIAGLAETLTSAVTNILDAIGKLPSSLGLGGAVAAPVALSTVGDVPVGGTPLGPRYGGGKAAGGAVKRGMWYDVNERGRETITLGTNGHVTPAHRSGAGGGVSIDMRGSTFHGVSRADAQSFAHEVENQLRRSPQIAIDY